MDATLREGEGLSDDPGARIPAWSEPITFARKGCGFLIVDITSAREGRGF